MQTVRSKILDIETKYNNLKIEKEVIDHKKQRTKLYHRFNYLHFSSTIYDNGISAISKESE